ncbi:AbfB domain-containing protein [Bacillus cereus]|uniref:AbfB domain-containing protein n=1 Tax=Bacillus cereus TaxID=1396 RepID=UPI000B4B4E1D|nr:AbfB domain-containing protein [Bacillus cereus]
MAYLSLYSNNYPNMYIREVTGSGELTTIQTESDQMHASFEWTGAWKYGESGQIRLIINPLIVLRHLPEDNFRIHFSYYGPALDPEAEPKVRADSTFILEPGLIDPNQYSFRSSNYPNRYIRHRDFHLYTEPINQYPDHQYATFRKALPLYQPRY